jgi:hypothetical protein
LAVLARAGMDGIRGATRSGRYQEALVLLCHKMRRFAWCWQHGQRMIVRAMAFAMVIRTDVIEFGTWRSGRIGGSSGSVTVG